MIGDICVHRIKYYLVVQFTRSAASLVRKVFDHSPSYDNQGVRGLNAEYENYRVFSTSETVFCTGMDSKMI